MALRDRIHDRVGMRQAARRQVTSNFNVNAAFVHFLSSIGQAVDDEKACAV
jgi:hypothetical protein